MGSVGWPEGKGRVAQEPQSRNPPSPTAAQGPCLEPERGVKANRCVARSWLMIFDEDGEADASMFLAGDETWMGRGSPRR